MAVLDGERHVPEGIGSLLMQTHADFELIVVDDGSRDGTADAVRALGDPRIRLVRNERNLGLSASLNRALGLARGELVARQDVDDVSAPERLENQVAFLDAHPEVALVGSAYREVDDARRPIADRSVPTEHADIVWAMHFHSPFVHSAVMWRRVPVRDEVGGYDERLAYSMDYDLWRRIAARFRVANLPEPLVELRVHDRSMTATYGSRADEGRRARASHVGRVLGWPEAQRGADGETDSGQALVERFERLRSLLHGPVRPRAARDLADDVRDLYCLHGHFCGERSVHAATAVAQRRRMQNALRRRLFDAARQCLAEGRRRDALAHLACLVVGGTGAVERAGNPKRGAQVGG